MVNLEANFLENRGLKGGEHLNVSEFGVTIGVVEEVEYGEVEPLLAEVDGPAPADAVGDVFLDGGGERGEELHRVGAQK